MRKFVLIAAMVLASASAQAAGSRGLTLASNDEPAGSTQPAPAPAAAPADAPKYVERPSAVDTKAPEQPKVDTKSDARPIVKAERKRHHVSTEARVISELHRYGIYW
ncbi:MAG TPA: hypothetical protein VFB02_05445 [Bradyrhizobium sp.]|nr:hypothetical protein [Bradyrhizobium sp.]